MIALMRAKKSQSLVRLSSSPLNVNSAFLTDHPCVLQLVRQEMKAWNDRFNLRYDTIRLQTMKLHHFPWISMCFVSCSDLWCIWTQSSMFPLHPRSFSVLQRLRWQVQVKAAFKHVVFSKGVHFVPKMLAVHLEIYTW